MTVRDLDALLGKEFPGGTGRIEPYESILLHDAVLSPRSPRPHPVWAFLAAQRGMGMTLSDIYDWFSCPPEVGPMLGECAMAFRAPLRTAVDYRVRGRIVSAVHKTGRSLGPFDLVTFVLEMSSGDLGDLGGPDVAVTYTFVLPAGARPPAGDGRGPAFTAPPGEPLPDWEVAAVGETEMKIMALLLRDPNPIHIDAGAARRLGLGDTPVNQGPVNLAYVISMLSAAFPDAGLRRLRARFLGNVLGGQRVVAGGVLTGSTGGDRECAVWLRRADGSAVVTGEAVVS